MSAFQKYWKNLKDSNHEAYEERLRVGALASGQLGVPEKETKENAAAALIGLRSAAIVRSLGFDS